MKIRVQKKKLTGEVVGEYQAVVLHRDESAIILEALFNRDDMPFMGVTLKRNDRFVETFYLDRWFNIFEIHDREDDHFKGYYCNIATPAVIEDGVLSFRDLALDLWVSANGEQTVLDEDEFEELHLDKNMRARALTALDELKDQFKTNNPPK